MAVALEYINVLVKVSSIGKLRRSGGWEGFKQKYHAQKTWYDGRLFRSGATDWFDIEFILDSMKKDGLKLWKTIGGVRHACDICVIDHSGPTLPCSWIETGNGYAWLAGTDHKPFVDCYDESIEPTREMLHPEPVKIRGGKKAQFRFIRVRGLPGIVYLHGVPGGYEPLGDALELIEKHRIHTLVCLAELEEIEKKSPAYARTIRNNRVPVSVFRHMPIGDGKETEVLPDTRLFEQAVEETRQDLESGRNVLVHGAAGSGRSGTFTCALLLSMGIGLREAVSIVSRQGAGPETPAQKRFLEDRATGITGDTDGIRHRAEETLPSADGARYDPFSERSLSHR